MTGRLPFAVEVFGRLALSCALMEGLGRFLGAGEDRRILAGVLQDHAADLCALAFLYGANYGRGGGFEWLFSLREFSFCFPSGLSGPDFFNGLVGGVECLFGMCAEGLFGFLALLRIGDFLKLMGTGSLPRVVRLLPRFWGRGGLAAPAPGKLRGVGLTFCRGYSFAASCNTGGHCKPSLVGTLKKRITGGTLERRAASGGVGTLGTSRPIGPPRQAIFRTSGSDTRSVEERMRAAKSIGGNGGGGGIGSHIRAPDALTRNRSSPAPNSRVYPVIYF